jgi:hypothetical protein
MKLPVRLTIALLFYAIIINGQVSYLSGSYSAATASGSGGGGTPSLSYTAAAGTDRLLLFFMVVERDHNPGGNGDNWASNAPLGGSVPSVELNGVSLAHLNSQWYYDFQTTDTESDAEISIELMVFGMLEANIPTGTNSFTITGNYNAPTNAGDDAIFGAIMFENVDGISHIVDANCTTCDTINTSIVTPDDGNNAVFSIAAASSERSYTNGTGYTGLGSSSVANASGNHTGDSERDGISVATQSISGTTADQYSPFGISGSADVFGMMLSAYRITSPTLLPVELIGFRLEQIDDRYQLVWKTASEINNKHFVIEYSRDGFDWVSIDSVAGYGNSFEMRKYVYQSDNLQTGYYRLKQVDFDGKCEYSRKVYLVPEITQGIQIVYSQHQEGLNLVSEYEMKSVEIFDVQGRFIKSLQIGNMQQFYIANYEFGNLGTFILKVNYEYGDTSVKAIVR